MKGLQSIYTLSLLASIGDFVNGQGEFTLACDPLTYQRGDPIVSPGEISNHTHIVIGGTAFNLSMSQDAAQNSAATTCSVAIDKSNYWQPLLYHRESDGQFKAVDFQGNVRFTPIFLSLKANFCCQAVYYLQRACDYADGRTSCPTGFMPKAPPAGLRMLSGNPNLRYGIFTISRNLHMYTIANRSTNRNWTDTFAQRAQSHMCLTNSTSVYTNSLPTQPCLRLRSQVFFPSCWDGKNLDSPDHSHVYLALATTKSKDWNK